MLKLIPWSNNEVRMFLSYVEDDTKQGLPRGLWAVGYSGVPADMNSVSTLKKQLLKWDEQKEVEEVESNGCHFQQ